jgi:hypothetical protein
MLDTVRKLYRLLAALGPLAVASSAFAAACDSCRCQRFTVECLPTGIWQCADRAAWRRPTRQRFAQALRWRLGTAQVDFRRRAESTQGIDAAPPDTPPIATFLLAGKRALANERVKKFLLTKATGGQLQFAYPEETVEPKADTVTLLTGVEADVEGQACLLELRRRGIACEWLAASSCFEAAETPLREACLRQATPTNTGNSLSYTAIAFPQPQIPSRTALPLLRRPLRILTYRWHVPHQYELFKLGAEFTLVTDLGEGSCRWWDLGQRPFPANARFARWQEIDQREFDLAILHFDENVLHATEDAPGVGAKWGSTFRFLQQQLTIPRIAVCHGTPPSDPSQCRETLVDYLGDTPVVVNSHQAYSEWKFRRARVIWQGFDPVEFRSRPHPVRHQARILTLPGGAFRERPDYRGAGLLEQVRKKVTIPLQHLCVAEPNLLLHGNAYARAKFAHYIAALHEFDGYFNPTLHSPMPRSRGESMLCGLATVNASSHDVDHFIQNGINGFYASTADELADQIKFLVADPQRAWRIGLASRETAIRHFHIERYLNDWRNLVFDILGNDAI